LVAQRYKKGLYELISAIGDPKEILEKNELVKASAKLQKRKTC
jgi:hypothetical protein